MTRLRHQLAFGAGMLILEFAWMALATSAHIERGNQGLALGFVVAATLTSNRWKRL